jgi:carboxyl-terminal processing protease
MKYMTKLPFRRLFLIMAVLGFTAGNGFGQKEVNVSTDLKFREVLQLLDKYYIDSVNEAKLTEIAIRAVLKDLDPHSTYVSSKDVKRMNEPLEGSFEGVGINYVILEDTVFISNVVRSGPADKAGIVNGDRLMTIDGAEVSGKKSGDQKLLSTLRGKKGTQVNVGILRMPGNHALNFAIERDRIPIHSVDLSYMVDAETGYIKINRFSANTVKEFHEAIKTLKEAGMQDLILDIRGNTGGYLNAAVDLSDEFLQKDQAIVSTRGLNSPETMFKAHGRGKFESGPLIVLLDESSASASEILAGAIQDQDRGILAGRKTYGKGLVQKPYYLPDGSMVRLTTARYYTPSGRCIQKPFSDGTDKYFKEIALRRERGEFVHPDTIQFPDSLRYTTAGGRIVYGGGGIVPDVFLPADSVTLNPFYIQAMKGNTMTDLCLDYLEGKREMLKTRYPDPELFLKSFVVGDSLFTDLVSRVKEGKDTALFQEKDVVSASGILKNQFKANIARDLYDPATYFRVLLSQDPWMSKVGELMNEGKVFSYLEEK